VHDVFVIQAIPLFRHKLHLGACEWHTSYSLLDNVRVNCVICIIIQITIFILKQIHKKAIAARAALLGENCKICTKSFMDRGFVPGPIKGAYSTPSP